MTAPSIKEALEKCAAALQLLPRFEDDVIQFTGHWAHFKPMSVAAILDEANTALATLQPSGERREEIARIMVRNDPNYETYHMPGDAPRMWKSQSGYVGITSELSEDCAERVRKRADHILASGLVQDEAGIRKDERDKQKERDAALIKTLFHPDSAKEADRIAAAIRSARNGGAET
jgi:hypothetical protein